MNILYQTCGKLNSTSGGTERTTITMAEALTRLYGARCFSIYERFADTPKEKCIVAEFQWSAQRDAQKNKEVLRKIIVENDIDFVIIQGAFIHVPRFRAAVENTKCKIIFAHHFEPRWELVYDKFSHLIKHPQKSLIGFARWSKNILFFPFTATRRERQLSMAYRLAYECADNVVLLCKCFIRPYNEFAGMLDTSKYVIIPNGLSFNFMIRYDELPKDKVVLIVSRLDETQKRLSLALRIWAKVKQNSVADGSDTLNRYINSNGRVSLFVRINRKENNQASPYIYLGEAEYVSHSGSKPVGIVWKLKHKIPAKYLDKMKKN